jgi:hypothetical protein
LEQIKKIHSSASLLNDTSITPDVSLESYRAACNVALQDYINGVQSQTPLQLLLSMQTNSESKPEKSESNTSNTSETATTNNVNSTSKKVDASRSISVYATNGSLKIVSKISVKLPFQSSNGSGSEQWSGEFFSQYIVGFPSTPLAGRGLITGTQRVVVWVSQGNSSSSVHAEIQVAPINVEFAVETDLGRAIVRILGASETSFIDQVVLKL